MKLNLLKKLMILLSVMSNIDIYGQILSEKQGYFNGHKWEIDIYVASLTVDGRLVLPKFITITPWKVGDELFFEASPTPGKTELYDIDGNKIIPYRFSDCYSVQLGNTYFIVIEKSSVYDNYRDLFSTNGKLIVADVCHEGGSQYTFISKDTDYGEIFRVHTKDGYGVLNTAGDVVIPIKYKQIEWSKDEDDNVITFEITNNNDYVGIMDRRKNWIVPLNKQFKEIKRVFWGEEVYYLCTKLENNDWAYYKLALYNNNSNEILPPLYSSISEINKEGKTYFKCYKDGYCGLYDITGKEIISPDYSNLDYLGSNYWGFKLNGYWGVMTIQGKVIIPTSRRYTSIGRFIKSQKRFTYSMDGFEGECNHLGQQVSKRRVAKAKPSTPVVSSSSTSKPSSNNTSSTSSKSSSNTTKANNRNSDNKTTTVVVEHKHDPVPVQQWQACFACGGMGTMGCTNCGGSGTKYIGDRLYTCSRCNGRGIIPCNVCFGNKGQYITVYQ